MRGPTNTWVFLEELRRTIAEDVMEPNIVTATPELLCTTIRRMREQMLQVIGILQEREERS